MFPLSCCRKKKARAKTHASMSRGWFAIIMTIPKEQHKRQHKAHAQRWKKWENNWGIVHVCISAREKKKRKSKKSFPSAFFFYGGFIFLLSSYANHAPCRTRPKASSPHHHGGGKEAYYARRPSLTKKKQQSLFITRSSLALAQNNLQGVRGIHNECCLPAAPVGIQVHISAVLISSGLNYYNDHYFEKFSILKYVVKHFYMETIWSWCRIFYKFVNVVGHYN